MQNKRKNQWFIRESYLIIYIEPIAAVVGGAKSLWCLS